MILIISMTNSFILPILVLLSPWYFSFFAESSATDANNNNNNCNDNNSNNSPFKIIVDGGSTGSRLHIFELVEVDDEENEYVRRGSSRAHIPLSAFGRLPFELNDDNTSLNPTEIAAHLLPLFEYAATIIPPQYYESTFVYYQGTAGMRLLETSEQEAVYDALFEGLMEDQSFVFCGMQRNDISTLSGEMEAYFGALSANYILGLIDTKLRVISISNGEEKEDRHPVGALDMGGSSTQIVYIANKNEKIDLPIDFSTCPIVPPQYDEFDYVGGENTCRLSDEHFFSTSYLSYGVDQFRERLWNTFVEEHVISEDENKNGSDDDTCGSKVIFNPYANKGYEVKYNGFSLLGTGSTEECIRQIKRLIPHPEIPHDFSPNDNDDDYNDINVNNEWVVGGIEHPPIQGKFLAMSLYFFSLDSLRVFSQPDEVAHTALNKSWPNPSIDELYKALDGLCSRDWHGDMALQEDVHSFTRAEVLPHRCLETAYMVTLLRDGFGFHPSSRDITFTFLVDGDEVEWTLGMALAMNADERGIHNNNGNLENTGEERNGERYNDDNNNCSEVMNNTIEDENEDQFQGVSMESHLFGIALPPTHCC